MAENDKLVQKATVTVSDLTAGGGKLKDSQAQRFIDYVVDESAMTKMGIRIVRIKPEQHDIPKVSVGTRAVYPASEGSDPGFRRSVTTSKITLRHDKVIIPWKVTEDTIWYNVEQSQFNDHVMRMLADTARNNFEEMCFSSNILGPAVLEDAIKDGGSTTQYVKDGFLSFSNGWLEEAYAGHPVNLNDKVISLSMFSQMLKSLPDKYKRDKSQLIFVTSPDVEQDLRMTIGARATASGDTAVFGGANDVISVFGVPVFGLPLFPDSPQVTEHLAFTGSGSTVSLRYPNVSNVSVHISALANVATTAYAPTADYTVSAAAGTVTHVGGGAIGANETVKVTYNTRPQILLTHRDNLIFVMSEDLRLKTDYNIYEDTFEFAMHARVGCKVQETDICVLGYNLMPLSL